MLHTTHAIKKVGGGVGVSDLQILGLSVIPQERISILIILCTNTHTHPPHTHTPIPAPARTPEIFQADVHRNKITIRCTCTYFVLSIAVKSLFQNKTSVVLVSPAHFQRGVKMLHINVLQTSKKGGQNSYQSI